MKRLNKILLVLLVAVALAGCRTDNDFGFGGASEDNSTPDVVPFSLAVKTSADTQEEEFDTAPATRTVFVDDNAYDYRWSFNDVIGFSAVGASDNQKAFGNVNLVNNKPGANRATIFDGALPKTVYEQMRGSAQNYRYTAYYPYDADALCSVNANGQLIIEGLELATVQNPNVLGLGGFPTTNDFMITKEPVVSGSLSTTNVNNINLEFVHLFAAVQFNLTDDKFKNGAEKITKITLTALNGAPLTGEFNVNTSTGEVTFVDGQSYVEINIPSGGMGENDPSVWAIVNPAAINGDVELTIETASGFTYTYTYPETRFAPSVFNEINFVIPAFELSADIYTSYTRYAAGNVAAANALNGSTIYFENVAIGGANPATDNMGGRYDIPYVESGVVCNNARTPLSNGTTSTTYTCTAASQWGEYNAQVYVKFANNKIVTSSYPNVHVTGLPYDVPTTFSTLPSGWSGGNLVYKGYDISSGDVRTYLRLEGKEKEDQSKNGWVVLPIFDVPSLINVTTLVDNYLYSSSSYKGYIYAAASSGSYSSSSSNGVQKKGALSFAGQATFTTDSFELTLSSSNPYVTVYANKFGGTIGVTYFTIKSISVKYR